VRRPCCDDRHRIRSIGRTRRAPSLAALRYGHDRPCWRHHRYARMDDWGGELAGRGALSSLADDPDHHGCRSRLLSTLARWLQPDTVLVSPNGKSYDSPLLRARSRLARLPSRHVKQIFTPTPYEVKHCQIVRATSSLCLVPRTLHTKIFFVSCKSRASNPPAHPPSIPPRGGAGGNELCRVSDSSRRGD